MFYAWKVTATKNDESVVIDISDKDTKSFIIEPIPLEDFQEFEKQLNTLEYWHVGNSDMTDNSFEIAIPTTLIRQAIEAAGLTGCTKSSE